MLPLESSISQQYFIFLSSLQSKMPTLILTHLITLLIEKFLFLIQELKALFIFIHLDSGDHCSWETYRGDHCIIYRYKYY